MKEDNQTKVIETSTIAISRGRGGGGRNIQEGRSGSTGHPQCLYCKRIGHNQEICYFSRQISHSGAKKRFSSILFLNLRVLPRKAMQC